MSNRANIQLATNPDLPSMCCDAYKDHYGIKGRHLLQWSTADLLNWWHQHYTFNEENNTWEFIDEQ